MQEAANVGLLSIESVVVGEPARHVGHVRSIVCGDSGGLYGAERSANAGSKQSRQKCTFFSILKRSSWLRSSSAIFGPV